MNLYASIAQRKTCRKYDLQPLAQEVLEKIENAIQSFEPCIPILRFNGDLQTR